MSGGIETRIDGSATAVDTTASWLRKSLRGAVSTAAEHVVEARRTASRDWEGHASHAYQDYAATIVEVTDEHEKRIDRAAGKLDSYSGKLTAVKDRMREFRTEARTGGLDVVGTVIQAPDPAQAPAAPDSDATPEQVSSYESAVSTHNAKVELYNRLAHDVTKEAYDFVDWVDANLTPVAASLDAPALDKLVDFLRDNAGNLAISAALTGSERALKDKVKALSQEAKDLKRARRSGHPGRRALGRDPATRGRIRDLNTRAGWLGKGGKLLGPLGGAIEIWNALESESPGGGLLAAGLGIGAGALVVATAPVSVPAAAVVAGAVVVGAGVSWGATKLWEALPEDWTEPVDEWVGDRWDDTKDTVKDGWNTVKGWF